MKQESTFVSNGFSKRKEAIESFKNNKNQNVAFSFHTTEKSTKNIIDITNSNASMKRMLKRKYLVKI